ncbi:MAG: mechanosensitive ion channel family protein [Chloroflexi bacterium]|nr:mechanosensitive ion channel family protein [Chloroflexota bacterium]
MTIHPLLLAFDRDGVNDWLRDHGTAVVGTLALTLLAAFLVRRIVPHALRPAVVRQMTGRPPEEVNRRVATLSGVIIHSSEVVLVAFAFFTIMPEFGFDIRAVLAGVSITGIALGLGAQSLVRDALNGIFILSENQYAKGDIVTVAGVTGTVEDVTLRRTLIRDFDGVLFTVPNGSVIVSANFTRDYSHVRVSVPVAPASDMAKVREVADAVGRALAEDPQYREMILTPPAYLRVDNIDMMGVAVQVNGTVQPGRQWEVAGVLRMRLLEGFQQAGVKTPWG